MAEIVIVLGESGSGKSTSLRNFEKDKVKILNVSGKKLPFKNELSMLNLRNYSYQDAYTMIMKAVKKYEDECKTFVIDDTNYLMSFEYFDSTVSGYEKYNQLGKHFKELLDFLQRDIKDDVIVYMLTHIEKKDNEKYAMKTVGKLLDEKLTIEGLVTICIRCIDENGHHFFKVHGDGTDTVKTPIGMFEEDTIDNDLAIVDKAIRDYYGY